MFKYIIRIKKSNFIRFLKRRKRAVIILAALFLFLLFPIEKPLVGNEYSRVITDKNGRIMRVFLTSDEQYCLPPEFNKEIPEKLKEAVIHFEDKYFRYHPGINPVSLFRAVVQNIKGKRIVSGASTITMQLARIRKGRERNVFNKFLEISEAVRMEFHFTKKEILKNYLDHAPYGGNIIGYQAACWRYFGKPPDKMSWAEASLIAILPNSPGRVSPVKNRDVLIDKRNRLLSSLYEGQKFDSITLINSINEPIPDKIVPFDLSAPHLTRRLNQEKPDNQRVIHSSIDFDIQERANYIVKRYNRQLQHYGIKNVAVIIIENKNRKVRAYIGSQDFYGESGRVDGVVAMRSSGSLLKPFLYALSVQDGIILPESIIHDIPTYYGTFSPHNASEMYGGLVTAHDALVRSLNVPAVRLLYTYGHYRFYNFLKEAGISTLFRSADSYGLPLIIGGAEVQLEEISSMFCGLANLGNFAPVSFNEENEGVISKQLIDTLSSVLILNTLNDLQRPGAEYYWTKFNSQFPVAWKTGTSYGHKDAWAVGINPDYTVGVWVGNFNAESNKNLSGAASAGPLLFDLFDILPHHSANNWWKLDDYEFEKVAVCEETGYLATQNCKSVIAARAPSLDKLKQCSYHITAETDSSGKYLVCSKCWEKGHHPVKYLSYPPVVIDYLRRNGSIIEKIPQHNPHCTVHQNSDMFAIEYPKENTKILVSRDFDGAYQSVVFSAVHKLQDQNIYWYLDNIYLGMTHSKHKMAVIPKKGAHTLTLVDSFGNTKKVNFYSTRNE
ncbi:MAG: penicillin-binding protein 1C [Bacteroidales bacterium]|nr:penicillin-binding protein 1C [Bacteroidales bacterium]